MAACPDDNYQYVPPSWRASSCRAREAPRSAKCAAVLERANLAGALAAVAMYALYIVVFATRMAGRLKVSDAAGWIQFALAIPLVPQLVLAFVQRAMTGR